MTEKPKPAYDAFAVEQAEGSEKAFFRPIGAAWHAKSNNGALNLQLKVIPLDGRVLLLPYRPPPEKT